jgi:hypothetical protein
VVEEEKEGMKGMRDVAVDSDGRPLACHTLQEL